MDEFFRLRKVGEDSGADSAIFLTLVILQGARFSPQYGYLKMSANILDCHK
jgi:hypothetical protein